MERSSRGTSPRRVSARYRLVAFVLLVLALLGTGPAAATQTPNQDGRRISPTALNQIVALLAEKDARTPSEQKIDSNLLYAFRQSRGLPIAAGVNNLLTEVALDAARMTTVDITAFVSDDLLARLKSIGAQGISAHAEFRSVRATIPIDQVGTIAGWNEVIFIQPEQEGITSRMIPPAGVGGVDAVDGVARLSFAGRAQAVQQYLRTALPQLQQAASLPADTPGATQGLTITTTFNRSEGIAAHRAEQAWNTYGYTGVGVKVCVLSDGVNTLADLQASGDLPPVTVVPGQAGTGNEGSAMLEIVHDLAPGAQLFYATAFGGIARFASNILTLRNTYGCDIIIDDVTYPSESPFQLGQAPGVLSTRNVGLISQAVNTVTADGALYFSSAGNSGNLNDNTSGVWEGDFAPGGAVTLPGRSGTLLDFDPGAGVTAFNTITDGGGFSLGLSWADPLGASSNDYDLFLLDRNGINLSGISTNIQNGSQDPLELIPGGAVQSGQRVVVVQNIGAANRYLHVNTNRGRLTFGTSGQVYGHNAALPAFTVAAANAQTAPVFSAGTTVETFSSDGLRRHFFNPDSSPITPGNFSSTGGTLTQKPDLTAADGVSCAAPGFSTFLGTSAAAPHAGAIAALIRSANPALTPAQIRTILTSAPGAIDIEAPGTDRDSGAGVLDTLALMQQVNPTPVPLLSASVTFSEGALRNGNGFVEPGESAHIAVALTNPTLAAATDVQVSLALVAPPEGVKLIAPGPVSYSTLSASGGSFTNTAAPFILSLAPTVACDTLVNYTVTAIYGAGGNSPQVFTGSFRIGKQVNVTTTLDANVPPSDGGFYTVASGTQTGRLVRSEIASSCAGTSANPRLFTAVDARQYDAYTLTNTTASAICVTVTLTQPAGAPFFSVAYNASGYTPANPSANYLADVGNNLPKSNYSFQVAAGQSFTVVVHELEPGAGVGQQYTLKIEGLGKCDPPPPQPAAISTTVGSEQSAVIGKLFTSALLATVRDADGEPVPGVEVAFSAPADGASGSFPIGNTAITDAGGQASVPFAANATVGSYTVTANTTNPALGGATSFTLSNLPQLQIQPEFLLDGKLGRSYSQTLTASGGTGSGYRFTLSAGTLPAGLTLNPNGVISGTPAAAGSFSFTVTISDSANNTVTQQYQLTIKPVAVYVPFVSK